MEFCNKHIYHKYKDEEYITKSENVFKNSIALEIL